MRLGWRQLTRFPLFLIRIRGCERDDYISKKPVTATYYLVQFQIQIKKILATFDVSPLIDEDVSPFFGCLLEPSGRRLSVKTSSSRQPTIESTCLTFYLEKQKNKEEQQTIKRK